MTDVILKRQRMPWLWSDRLFKLTPEGREHERCLKIIHQFTQKVIADRAEAFQADQVQSKRSAFLGKRSSAAREMIVLVCSQIFFSNKCTKNN